MPDFIAYFRVSTKQQGASGLGIEAQQAAVAAYAQQAGGRIKASYVEVESGKRADRPELLKAIAHARRNKVTLVVAKLDRLSRDPDFLGALMKAGVDFVATDNPSANKLTVRILAAVAEQEREATSARTKAALAAYKARGGKLGSDRPGHWAGPCKCPLCGASLRSDCEKCGGTGTLSITREDRRRAGLANATAASVKVRRKKATDFYTDIAPQIAADRAAGLSLAKIARKLDEQGHVTRRGKRWNPVQVAAVLLRFHGI